MSQIQQPPLISLTDVTLHVEGRIFATHLNWTLHRGETWAIVGSTGAGKSLLAKTIAGLVPLIGGSIDYHFLEPSMASHGPLDRAQRRDCVAYVAFDERPGEATLFHQARWHASLEAPSPRVTDILTVDAIWRRNPYEITDRRLPDPAAFGANRERAIARLELTPLLGRQLHHLSDGEWRRVQIARGLLKAPMLLILDDPFTGLDRHFRETLQLLIPVFAQGDPQILLALPDGQGVPDAVTHVLVMERGRIAAQGAKNAVLPALGAGAPPAQPVLAGDEGIPDAVGAPEVIRMQDIRVVHDGLPILADITWTVRQGEKWALLGPNGAGKSTLLSLILGDHPQAYANAIALFGHPRGSGESVWEIKRRIGWVAPELQRYHPPQSTAFDVVCSGFFDTLGLYRPGSADQKAITADWMVRLGLDIDRTRPYRSLSRGEQRLALIARALVKDPELLILDEPCQGLDLEHQPRVLGAIDAIAGESGRTMIYVTHRPSEFPRGLTHVLELREGRIVRQGAMLPEEVPGN